MNFIDIKIHGRTIKALNFVYIISTDVITFACSRAALVIICGGFSFMGFYSGSYPKDVKFLFW